MDGSKNAPPIVSNRQAYHNYFIHDTYECGIALTGTEVKSIRAGKVNLSCLLYTSPSPRDS